MRLTSRISLLIALLSILLLTVPAANAYEPFSPDKIALGGYGNVYASFGGNLSMQSYIHVYTPEGREIRLIEKGTGGDFAVDRQDSVYLLDSANKTITKVSKDGQRSLFWESNRSSAYYCGSIAADDAGNIYVTEYAPDFNNSTGHNQMANLTDSRILKLNSSGDVVKIYGGSPPFPMNNPLMLTIGFYGTVYGTDLDNRIYLLTPDGNMSTMGKPGLENGTFNMITSVTFGEDGYLYVTEYGNHRVQKLYPNGTFVAKWAGCGPDAFIYPSGVAADKNGRVYVADFRDQRIVWLDGNNYTFGENRTANVAGKGVLWDNVVAGDNYTVMTQKIETENAAAETPGFTVVILATSFIVLFLIARPMRR
ncbi:NHL repeat-containing protein [Methanocella arvoryzae]|uniref:Uncharacterized protein n=1 Tax=Methanocella arvoryzae (strain DSM 22066 / NBRC 105507 / MRE50) TaxID=351160 RepID=Q0W6Z3_METAR|nr:NHL repeat-containing protein [Methanocella arvoryzae]CAJ35850.1 conserved hypothetical protein [Methanocella arvoryzae MRE50]